jgi:hypothetical protein
VYCACVCGTEGTQLTGTRLLSGDLHRLLIGVYFVRGTNPLLLLLIDLSCLTRAATLGLISEKGFQVGSQLDDVRARRRR